MRRILIKNADIVAENEVLKGHHLLIENGKIVRIIPSGSRFSDSSACHIIDAAGQYLCPGFIDLHFHRIHTYLVDNGPNDLEQICKILPRYGVTGFLPTVCPLPKGKDAAIVRSLAAGTYAGAPARLTRSNGLAGSRLTMNLAVKNAVEMLGADLPMAVKMASANPARVLRCRNKGSIKEGFDTDIVLMDKAFTVRRHGLMANAAMKNVWKKYECI